MDEWRTAACEPDAEDQQALAVYEHLIAAYPPLRLLEERALVRQLADPMSDAQRIRTQLVVGSLARGTAGPTIPGLGPLPGRPHCRRQPGARAREPVLQP